MATTSLRHEDQEIGDLYLYSAIYLDFSKQNMDVKDMLNPAAGGGSTAGQADKDKGKDAEAAKNPDGSKKAPWTEADQKEWEDKQKSKGMPTQGLNTFRVKK